MEKEKKYRIDSKKTPGFDRIRDGKVLKAKALFILTTIYIYEIMIFVITGGPLSNLVGKNVYGGRRYFILMNELIREIEKENMKKEIPDFRVGDTVRVYVKVIEGNRERLQAFEGLVIAKRHGGVRETFTVRRLSYGIGIERTFPVHSPKLDRIEVIRRGKVRRAKLFYIRERVGKSAKVKDKSF